MFWVMFFHFLDLGYPVNVIVCVLQFKVDLCAGGRRGGGLGVRFCLFLCFSLFCPLGRCPALVAFVVRAI